MRMTVAVLCLCVVLGCAKVDLQTSKPIKVDISMRVDVYQHVSKEVDSIEDQIYGDQQKKLNFLFGSQLAYAQEYDAALSDAIQGRKNRLGEIEDYFRKGYVGENKEAYLQMRSEKVPQDLQGKVQAVVHEENGARKAIYQATAKKNGVDVSQTEKIFFQDHYGRAASGYWFEVYDEGQGRFVWKQK